MPFKEIDSRNLQYLRDQKTSASKSIFLANERILKVKEEEQRLRRYFNPENKAHITLLNSLNSQKKEAEAIISAGKRKIEELNVALDSALKEFYQYTDPRTNLNRLDETIPILLMPLRMETRFKRVDAYNDKREKIIKDQLWVRVFPDDCSVDTFEEVLSEAEIKDIQNFWIDWWIAAGNEGLRRSAWKNLVSSRGHGRAQYIINHYTIDNRDEILHSGEDLTAPAVYLVINGYPEIADEDKPALTDFWIAVWNARGDQALIEEARATLYDTLGERSGLLISSYPPKNINDQPPVISDGEELIVEVKFIEFKDITEFQKESWSHAPKVCIMPERLCLLGYTGDILSFEVSGSMIPFPLIVGPDPKTQEEDMIRIPGTDIKITPEMRWMIDFDEAVSRGMGFKIDLTPSQVKAGFSRILVLGVKMSSTGTDGKMEFENLITHHYSGNSGFGFLPIGTPTNNTLTSPSGYNSSEDSDESFDMVFKNIRNTSDHEAEQWWEQSDRKWFCEMLGISEEVFSDMINTDGFDQREARAMNISLWPATWGYFFDTMLQPVLNDTQIEQIRWFFNHFVVGRGTVPSVRISDQPYGIMPATVFSRISWLDPKRILIPRDIETQLPGNFSEFLAVLYSKFKIIQEDWKKMAENAAYVGKDGDPHKLLVDILGLHGGSVEFHSRLGESFNHIYNLYQLSRSNDSPGPLFTSGKAATSVSGARSGNDVTFDQVMKAIVNSLGGYLLLRELGYTGEESPEILEKLFVLNAEKLTGPLIDDVPLSEINPVRTYSNGIDGTTPENYIQWLIRVTGSKFDDLRTEKGFIDNRKPSALLYLMLKHALELGYWESGYMLYRLSLALDSSQLQIIRREPDFIHIRPLTNVSVNEGSNSDQAKSLDYPAKSESRYNLLYQAEQKITRNETMLVADYIPQIIQQDNSATKYLYGQIKALEMLAETPTSRLERAFVEHIDCASYRFDAWKLGILNYHLKALRNPDVQVSENNGNTTTLKQGLYIGAYGWLENVRSEYRELTEVELDDEQMEVFNPDGTTPVYRDRTNLGYINAPSLNHAVTAAILCNGYLARSKKDNAEMFNINLSSERVRKALTIIEGIQNGQNLAALLGYHFERGLHDNNPGANIDQYIFKIRRKFPLISNQLKSTYEPDESIPIEAIEARNVVNGLDLIQFAESDIGPDGEPLYFDGLNLGSVTQAEKNIIVNEINNIRDINDAVADLAFAESIHQVVQGNIERAAGTLDTYSSGNYPQVPDVIQTPRNGVNMTHRIGLQIKADADPSVAGYTPRAMAEPGLNRFLEDILPDLSIIRCYVSFFHLASGSEITEYPVSMADLMLQPVDLLYIISKDTNQSMTALDDLVMDFATNIRLAGTDGTLQPPRPDADIKITYFKRMAGYISVFEIAPLIEHLRAVILRSRPLQASDVMMSPDAGDKSNSAVTLNRQRIDMTLARVSEAKLNLDSYITDLTAILENEDDTIDQTDVQADAFVDILNMLMIFGLPQTGTGFVFDWIKKQMRNLLGRFEKLVGIWQKKEAEYMALLADYDLLPDEQKLDRLIKVERIVSTIATPDPGTDPSAFKTNIIDVKINNFNACRDNFNQFLGFSHSGISEALAAAIPLLDYKDFYFEAIDVEDIKRECLLFAESLLTKASLIQADLGKRISAVNGLLAEYIPAASPDTKVQLLQDAARQLFTDDFKMIPSFAVPSVNAQEWQKSYDKTGELLSYQTDVLNNPLPVDDWFYGVARVREKAGHLEKAILLAEGFNPRSFNLSPVQFPCQDPYCWFAMEFGNSDPELKKQLDIIFRENDHLLYTAYYHVPFAATGLQCGLLIDEWTEIVPTENITSGLTFHYDRPNSEPPQVMLLAMSPQLNGNGWIWQDLVDILHETLLESKLRAVEPEQIDRTGYANLLPATISTITKHPISMMLNYVFNNLSPENS
jgi:hypothetical protein